jgi:hypothetical protein
MTSLLLIPPSVTGELNQATALHATAASCNDVYPYAPTCRLRTLHLAIRSLDDLWVQNPYSCVSTYQPICALAYHWTKSSVSPSLFVYLTNDVIFVDRIKRGRRMLSLRNCFDGVLQPRLGPKVQLVLEVSNEQHKRNTYFVPTQFTLQQRNIVFTSNHQNVIITLRFASVGTHYGR